MLADSSSVTSAWLVLAGAVAAASVTALVQSRISARSTTRREWTDRRDIYVAWLTVAKAHLIAIEKASRLEAPASEEVVQGHLAHITTTHLEMGLVWERILMAGSNDVVLEAEAVRTAVRRARDRVTAALETGAFPLEPADVTTDPWAHFEELQEAYVVIDRFLDVARREIGLNQLDHRELARRRAG